MLNWLNQNAGAVQAMMAILIGLLTVTLIIITTSYTRLTRRMAETMERQLAASFQPDIELKLLNEFKGSTHYQGKISERASGTIVVTNKVNIPIEIVATAIKIVFDDKNFPDASTTQGVRHRVVSPGIWRSSVTCQ